MDRQILPEKKIIGIAVKTLNEEGHADVDIKALWERFYSEEVLQKVPNRINGEIIGLYTDYEGDYTKPYTLIAGCEVSSLDEIPQGMVGKVVPAASYHTYPVDGDFPDTLISTWQKIWVEETSRSYTCDLEIYPEGFDPVMDTDMKIYISVEGG